MAQRESGSDPLFEIKNMYYLGEFQRCVNDAQKAKITSPDLKLERDIYMYRAYIGLEKYKLVLDELRSTSSQELKALSLLAEYLQIIQGPSVDENKRAAVVKKLDDKLSSGEVASSNYVFFVTAGTIYCYEENYEAALRVLHQSDHLECLSYSVFTYCKMERADQAGKVVKRMQETDEDATLTQLAEATLNMQLNGKHVQEAYHIFHDLFDKYAHSTIALNGMVAALVNMGRHEEAESFLQEALQKDTNNPNILINLVICGRHTDKSDDVINRYVNQLRDSHPNHPLSQLWANKEREFDRVSKQYAPEVTA